MSMMVKRIFPVLLAGALCIALGGCGQRYGDFSISTPLLPDEVLVLGIVGGIERFDDNSRGVPRLAENLRALNLPHLKVETVENHRLELAVALIVNAFDRDGDGRLSDRESDASRLIIFGHSMGGAAVVALARKMYRMGVPILLTIQIDSFGPQDRWIPPNVQRAANFFQANGFLVKGEPSIAAIDEQVTQILGNFEFDYSDDPVDMVAQKFIRRLFNTPHDQMAADPYVWNRVQDLIVAQLDFLMAGG